MKGFRKHKSKKYQVYQRLLYIQLNGKEWIFDHDMLLDFTVTVGVSSKLSDLDNICKPLFDTLSMIYGWNDNKIYHIDITKELVKKGEEYVQLSARKWVQD